MFAFFDNEPNTMSKWLKKKAPDEYADFNMLDLFRYMIKIRCYIVYKQYTAAIALAERLRPLLIEGNSFPGQDNAQEPSLNAGTYKAILEALAE